MSNESEVRAEFEAWVQDCGCDTDGAWSAWQAAWSRRTPAQAGAGAVAWIVYAPNGKVRLWSTDQRQANECAEAHGLTVTPVYAHPPETAKLVSLWFDEWELILPPDARESFRNDLLPSANASPPAALLEQAREALAGALFEYDRNVCTHEETHRGGVLWTICDACGARWADDEGGFKPYQDPPKIEQARAALSALEAHRKGTQ